MKPKPKEREKAIELRHQGLSYSEILKHVPVSQSSLSLWLSEIHLTKTQKAGLLKKRVDGNRKGARVRRMQRIQLTKEIKNKAYKEVRKISKREFWLIGTALYWAEGSKERAHGSSSQIIFSNSDPGMLFFFKNWLTNAVRVSEDQITYELYIHITHIQRIGIIKKYWTQQLKITPEFLSKVYFKREKTKKGRKNTENEYYGLVRIRVKKSSSLNRAIAGWSEGIAASVS